MDILDLLVVPLSLHLLGHSIKHLKGAYYAPVNCTPHPPSRGEVGEGWGFDMLICQIPQSWEGLSRQIPPTYLIINLSSPFYRALVEQDWYFFRVTSIFYMYSSLWLCIDIYNYCVMNETCDCQKYKETLEHT